MITVFYLRHGLDYGHSFNHDHGMDHNHGFDCSGGISHDHGVHEVNAFTLVVHEFGM